MSILWVRLLAGRLDGWRYEEAEEQCQLGVEEDQLSNVWLCQPYYYLTERVM